MRSKGSKSRGGQNGRRPGEQPVLAGWWHRASLIDDESGIRLPSPLAMPKIKHVRMQYLRQDLGGFDDAGAGTVEELIAVGEDNAAGLDGAHAGPLGAGR